MSVLRVIRHGQASYFADDYDQLSPLGEEQGRALGRHWVAQDQVVHRVVVGPRRRHRQTLDAVAGVFRDAGREWPEAEEVAEFDEHCGQQVVHQTLPGWIEDNVAERPEFAELLGERTLENLRLYFQAFREITGRWTRGDLPTPNGLESWGAFRRRVDQALERITEDCITKDCITKDCITKDREGGETIAIFTSGGPVGNSTGLALGLGNEKVMELSWRVRNTAYADLVWSENRLTLDSFNAIPHLADPRLVTYI